MSRPRFRTRRTKDPSQDPHWQDVRSPTSWQHLRPIPHKRDPPREVSASHDLPPAPIGMWDMTRGTSQGREHQHQRAWGTIPRAMQVHQLAAMQAAGPDKSLNAGLTGCAAIPSPSSPTLPHASSARGTQAPPTTSSGLDLGSSVAGYSSTRAG
jgi:hypothetical protein